MRFDKSDSKPKSVKSDELQCPCKSGKAYADCCERFHQGQLPETALLLMRSRYSAYALHLNDYIMDTTHPENPRYELNKAKLCREISEFSLNTEFKDLIILSFEERGLSATVTFFAELGSVFKGFFCRFSGSFEPIFDPKWEGAVSTDVYSPPILDQKSAKIIQKIDEAIFLKRSLIQHKKDASYTEKSLFEKVNGKWLYIGQD